MNELGHVTVRRVDALQESFVVVVAANPPSNKLEADAEV